MIYFHWVNQSITGRISRPWTVGEGSLSMRSGVRRDMGIPLAQGINGRAWTFVDEFSL